MNVIQDTSILSLVLNASIVVQAVMLLLVIVSIMSWYYIISKSIVLRKTKKESDQFEAKFWSGGDLNKLLTEINFKNCGSLEKIFEAGFKEFSKLRQRNFEAKDIIDSARRGMQAVNQREMDEIEAHLQFLATVGSVSPYVGLFGTVWGIMHSFHGLGKIGQATLATVAPGISEALVATAIGLFAAIPAVVAYNKLISDADRISTRFQSFIEEFSNILQRQLKV